MNSIIIASNSSGGGKTTITLGLMKALMKRGLRVQGYKVGPDYIDPAFHSHVTNTASRNLDIFLMGEDGVKAAYCRGAGDVGVIEGVMGLYDGIGITTDNSTAHVSRLLNIPVVLVLSPKGQSTTVCAEIRGLIEFENADIRGVILNGISESYYKLLKAAIEKYCGIKVFGYVPFDERLSLKSRHLGLVQSSEIEDLNHKIEICSELLEKYADIEELLKQFLEAADFDDNFHIKRRGIKTAVALDKAFSFYYKENLELLKELGEVEFFSPLKDKALPEGTDFLYLGGGYPEVFIKELSENESIRKDINEKLSAGLHCYAECGGLMYLMDSIAEEKTVGFFKGSAGMSSRLQNFGYAKAEISKENGLLPVGLQVKCHEFHKSFVESEEETIYELTKKSYDGAVKSWPCGYKKYNTIGAYAHVHFFSNIKMLECLTRDI